MGDPESKTILLVEDEVIVAITEQMILENHGYRVITVKSGEKAVETIESSLPVDLILMDIDLGTGIDGTEAAELILARSDVPLIFISSHTEREIVEKTEGITSYGYIVKNTGETVLIASIKMAFRLHEARRRLEEEKEHLRITLHSIGDAVIATDTGGRITRMNPVAERLTGWVLADALGRKIEEVFRIINAHTRKPVKNPVERALAEGSIVGLANHTVLISKSGREYQISDSGAPIRDGEGKVTGVVLVFRDVTEEYRSREALAHSHELMRYVIENSRSAIAVHDRDLRYIYVSRRYLEEYRVKERDVIGKHHYEVFPDLPRKWRDVHKRALNGEISSAEDDPYVREDGTVDLTRWECRPWYEADGSIGGIIVYTEVTGKGPRVGDGSVS